MSPDSARSFARYLEAKRTVDDRALNVRVWDRLAAELSMAKRRHPLRVLEVGGGVGTMVERLRYSGMLGRCDYTLLDSDAELIDAAQIRLSGSPEVQIEFVIADAFAFLEHEVPGRTWDLIVANAVLDLTDLTESVPAFLGALEEGGMLYASINYDGMTTFVPTIDETLDAQIERLYNVSMHRPLPDRTIPSGSRCGRDLIPELRQHKATILEAGSSDWLVYADDTGYHADEGYFLRHVLSFVEDTLAGHPEIDHQAFSRWIGTRYRQILMGELVYIAHQIDVLARKPVSSDDGEQS
jgi:SAM-dependent methyltransferase